MSIELEGLDEVLNSLDELADTANLEGALSKACAIVEADAKKKAPKGNGDLRRSITSKVEDDKGIVFTPLFYAPYVEYGTGLFAESGGRKDVPWCYQDDKGEWHSTSGMKPQPFMRPALNENREKIIKILKEGLTNHD
jgi:HK97 gp10 family phage protein